MWQTRAQLSPNTQSVPVLLPAAQGHCKQMTPSRNKALICPEQQRVPDPFQIPNLLKPLGAEKLPTGSDTGCCPRGIFRPSFERAPRPDLCQVTRRRVTCSGCKPAVGELSSRFNVTAAECYWAILNGGVLKVSQPPLTFLSCLSSTE